MVANHVLARRKKRKSVTNFPAQSTGFGRSGEAGLIAQNHAAAEPSPARENVTARSSEGKSVKANRLKQKNVELANVHVMASSNLGLTGENAAKNVVVASKKERANARVPSLEERIASVIALKYRLAKPSVVRLMEFGVNGAIGLIVPKRVQVAPRRSLAPAKVHFMAAKIAWEIIERSKSATNFHAPSMDSGSHGEPGMIVLRPAEAGSKSARENVKDLSTEEKIAREMSMNRKRFAKPIFAQSMESGASGETGESALMANSTRPAHAADLNLVDRIAWVTERKCRNVKRTIEHAFLYKPGLSLRI